MLCEIGYKKQPGGLMLSEKRPQDPGDEFRIRKIVGGPDHIFEWLRKQRDIALIKITVRAPNNSDPS
jgi:hypothetical protein